MADASRHRGVTDKKVWKTDNKGKELYGGGRWHVACYRMRGVKFMHGRPPTLIPVLVTGIQPTRVCVAERLLSAQGLGLTGSL